VISRGRFITLEGIDGAGKSTQASFIAEKLRARGIDPLVTREPGGTPLGEQLRELILHQPMSARAETLLLFAARTQHVDAVIAPALASGRWVLCDRFTDASFAYQGGGRGVRATDIETLANWVHADLWPDITLLFDLAPEVAAQRLAKSRPADRFETEQLAFFARVRTAYLARAQAEPARFVVFDGSVAPERLQRQLEKHIESWLSK